MPKHGLFKKFSTSYVWYDVFCVNPYNLSCLLFPNNPILQIISTEMICNIDVADIAQVVDCNSKEVSTEPLQNSFLLTVFSDSSKSLKQQCTG